MEQEKIIAAIKLADVQDNSIILYDKKVIQSSQARSVIQVALKDIKPKNVAIVGVTDVYDDLIKVVSEEQLNLMGWYRKNGNSI